MHDGNVFGIGRDGILILCPGEIGFQGGMEEGEVSLFGTCS